MSNNSNKNKFYVLILNLTRVILVRTDRIEFRRSCVIFCKIYLKHQSIFLILFILRVGLALKIYTLNNINE